VKLIDRKPKGYFVKDFFKVKLFTIPKMTAMAEWLMGFTIRHLIIFFFSGKGANPSLVLATVTVIRDW
jgi:hypothetical protein